MIIEPPGLRDWIWDPVGRGLLVGIKRKLVPWSECHKHPFSPSDPLGALMNHYAYQDFVSPKGNFIRPTRIVAVYE